MRTSVIIALLLLVMVSGCNQKKPINKQELEVSRDSVTSSLVINRILIPNDSGVIFLDMNRGRIKERIRKMPDENIMLEFNIEDTTRIFGRLSSEDSLANIRFSQIIMPDSTMDGPFGHKIEYDLKQVGTYRILVHENMMAGDPWGGVFTVRLTLVE